MRIRPNPAILQAELLRHYMDSPQYWANIHDAEVGVGMANVNATKLGAILVPVPPSSAQEQLVELLDAASCLEQSAASHVRSATRKIDHFQQAVLSAAVSGRLTADWREENESEPVLPGPELSAQAKAHTSGAPNTDDLIEIPSTWSWWPVESITERVIDYRGRTPPSEASGPIPHVRTTQIRHGRIDWDTDRFVTEQVYNEYMTRGIPRRGDVLFTMEAPMADVGVVDRDERFSIAQRILLLRPGDGLDSGFLSLALRSYPVRRAIEFRATGSGVLGIAYKRLRSVVVPKPPLGEQHEVVRRATELLGFADSVDQRVEFARQRVDRASKALLAKAFRGGLVS
jgi:type I restriction enzyme S subunit